MILHAEALIVKHGKKLFEFSMKMLFQYTPRKGAQTPKCKGAETVNVIGFLRTAWWFSQSAALMTTESCVKKETRRDNKSEFIL